jgi:ribosomal protein S18 acetylase RimI-like enzyme
VSAGDALRIRTLDTVDEARALEPLVGEYLRFVCADLEAAEGLSFDAERLIEGTMGALHKVVPPLGRTFVASRETGEMLGMVFLRKSGPDAMEIKRLYVVPDGRGTGAGRALVEAAIAEARAAGARSLRLDTTRNLTPAIGLYSRMGFLFRDPYPESDHFDDDILRDVLVFMEKALD